MLATWVLCADATYGAQTRRVDVAADSLSYLRGSSVHGQGIVCVRCGGHDYLALGDAPRGSRVYDTGSQCRRCKVDNATYLAL